MNGKKQVMCATACQQSSACQQCWHLLLGHRIAMQTPNLDPPDQNNKNRNHGSIEDTNYVYLE